MAESSTEAQKDTQSESFDMPPDTDNLVNGQKSKSSGEYSPLQVAESAQDQKPGMQEGLKIIIVTSVVFAISVTVALILTIYLAPPPVEPHGAVSCAVKACSDIGLEMLKKGSAMDAAVAAALCVGVVNPHHSGLGGGGFMSYREHKANMSAIFDFRETAPMGSKENMFDADPASAVSGGKSVAVPGELSGLYSAHSKYGSLSWSEVLTPVINLARDGFEVTESLHDAIVQFISADDDLARIFYRDGKPLATGDVLQRPDLADLLSNVSANGPDWFYSGDNAQEIVDTVKASKGNLTLEDLANYTPLEGTPLTTMFKDTVVEVPPAPSGGPILLMLLNIMGLYPLTASNLTDGLYYHCLIEAISYAYAQQGNLGDPEFSADAAENQQIIISPEFAKSVKSQISDETTQSSQVYASVSLSGFKEGTASVTVVSPGEKMVSIQTSLNRPFGSKLVTPSGVILNDQMADFDLPSDTANQNNLIAPGKRPLSALTPTLLHELNKPCGPRMALAGTNGSNVISGIAEVILNVIAFNQKLNEAIEMPRIHRHLKPDQVEYDRDFSTEILDFLRSKGHSTIINDLNGVNTVDAVFKVNETVTAHADSRNGLPGQEAIF